MSAAPLVAALSTVLLTACATPLGPASPAAFRGPGTSIWIVSHGWHVGLAMPREAMPRERWTERDALGDVRYLEVGWGDGDFYPAERVTIGLALKAVFHSTSSVLHVVGFDAPVASYFPASPIVEVELSPRGLDGLAGFIDHHYARDAAGRPIAGPPGLYGDAGRFYLSAEPYSAFRNSNHWTARALQAAGCPIVPRWAMTAGNVLEQALHFGRPVRDVPPATAAPARGSEDCRAPR